MKITDFVTKPISRKEELDLDTLIEKYYQNKPTHSHSEALTEIAPKDDLIGYIIAKVRGEL